MRAVILFLFLFFFCHCSSDTTDQTEAQNGAVWWTAEDRQLILSELDRTTNELNQEITSLSVKQWHFREDSSRWSICEIIEHLEMQNQLHFREISAVLNAPQYLQFRAITQGQDQYFSDYATSETLGKSNWFMEPLGRFPKKENAWNAFTRARSHLRDLVKTTTVDLRKQFTFRTPVEGKKVEELKIGQVRDLHQLLLTGIAHTDRHLRQIRKIKEHNAYPN